MDASPRARVRVLEPAERTVTEASTLQAGRALGAGGAGGANGWTTSALGMKVDRPAPSVDPDFDGIGTSGGGGLSSATTAPQARRKQARKRGFMELKCVIVVGYAKECGHVSSESSRGREFGRMPQRSQPDTHAFGFSPHGELTGPAPTD